MRIWVKHFPQFPEHSHLYNISEIRNLAERYGTSEHLKTLTASVTHITYRDSEFIVLAFN